MTPLLLDSLRQATSEAHAALEATIDIGKVVSDQADYRDYLIWFASGASKGLAMIDWQKSEEAGLPDAALRRGRYADLLLDLHDLDASGPPARPQGPSSLATSTGALYVLEGSIHGGLEMMRRIEEGPGQSDWPTRFIRGFGEQSRQTWREFVAWLDSFQFTRQEMAVCSTAAVQVFQGFACPRIGRAGEESLQPLS